MEEEFLSSPTTVVQEPAGPEPIEVDAVEIELHPYRAEELIADAGLTWYDPGMNISQLLTGLALLQDANPMKIIPLMIMMIKIIVVLSVQFLTRSWVWELFDKCFKDNFLLKKKLPTIFFYFTRKAEESSHPNLLLLFFWSWQRFPQITIYCCDKKFAGMSCNSKASFPLYSWFVIVLTLWSNSPLRYYYCSFRALAKTHY